MTPIGHCATGLGFGGILAPLFNLFFTLPYRSILIIFFISALLPDIDGLSLLVSHKVYYGKQWFSHHMAVHSLLGIIIISGFIAALYFVGAIFCRGIHNLFRRNKVHLEFKIRKFFGAWIASFLGCLVHVAGDLPTPPGPWGGIAFMWPSKVMFGGWSKIFWHNWYIIYISLIFLLFFLIINIIAGIYESIIKIPPIKKQNFPNLKYGSYILRGVSSFVALIFLIRIIVFISSNNYKKVGLKKWDAFNQSKVPKEYMKKADAFYKKVIILWRKKFFTFEDLRQLREKFYIWSDNLHRNIAPIVSSFIPSLHDQEQDMKAYRYLQSLVKGMEDNKPGDYRIWILRDIFAEPKFYDKAFTMRFDYQAKNNYLQISNAWMIVFHINKRDEKGKVLKVTRIYHSNKIYVPDKMPPQLNQPILKKAFYNFWKHDKISYNLIPRFGYSQFRTSVKGFWLSLNTIPGYIWPGIKSGIALHSGVWSAGCIIAVFGHFNFGEHLENPFYPLWESANEIIDINKTGSRFRGRKKIWGRMSLLKNPRKVKMEQVH